LIPFLQIDSKFENLQINFLLISYMESSILLQALYCFDKLFNEIHANI